MGVQPRVAAATAGLAKIFASITSLVQAMIDNELDWENATFYFAMGFIGSMIFANLLYIIVKKYNLQAVVVLIVFCLVMLTIASEIVYIALTWSRFGIDYLMAHGKVC